DSLAGGSFVWLPKSPSIVSLFHEGGRKWSNIARGVDTAWHGEPPCSRKLSSFRISAGSTRPDPPMAHSSVPAPLSSAKTAGAKGEVPTALPTLADILRSLTTNNPA